jgi:hypothetical protein
MGDELLAGLGALPFAQAQAGWTEFQMACMTLPYAAFPFAARTGNPHGGVFVAWGTTHPDAAEARRCSCGAGAGKARELAQSKKPA